MFVDANDAVYIVSQEFPGMVKVRSFGDSDWTRTISGSFNESASIFVGNKGDIYVDNGMVNHRVDKWGFNSTASISVMNVSNACFGLFIDANNSLYCSHAEEHRVVRKFLNEPGAIEVTYAGNGTSLSSPSTLNYPCGIFVHVNLSLYVADCRNDRIQRFDREQSNGTSEAGNGSTSTINLYCPTGVVLDGNGYLFIVDSFNHRIVASGPSGFRCIAGCSNIQGSGPDQLGQPRTLSFDSNGNIFVLDANSSRVQKFFLATSACGT